MNDFWFYYIVVCLVTIFGAVIYFKKTNIFWFSYDIYERAYKDYQCMIVRKQYSYERYCDYFIRTHEHLHLKGERKDKFQCLVDLIKSEHPLLHKYFQMNSFSKNDFVKMLDEYNKMPNAHQLNNRRELLPIPQKRELCFIDFLITLDEEKKQDLSTKVNNFLQTGAKSQAVAIMILALKKLGYLTSTVKTKTIYHSIVNQFQAEIGTYESVIPLLKKGVDLSFYNEQIESLMKYFKCD